MGADASSVAVGPHPWEDQQDQARTAGRLRRLILFVLVAFLNIATFMVCFQLYKIVRRTYIQRGQRVGYHHADQIIHLEKKLHLFFEIRLQHWLLDRPDTVIMLVNRWYSFFMWSFFICCIVAMARAPEQYRRLRRVFLLTMVIALPWYAIYPLAPPRFITGEGFIDTALVYGPHYLSGKGMITANRYAAMPSMHVGWTTIGACMLAVSFRRRWIGVPLGATLLTAMCLTVMVTGNHWFLDLIGGWLIVLAAFGVERLLPERIEFPWFRQREKQKMGTPAQG